MMVNPAMEGMGNATLSGTKPSYRQLSVGEADAARRTEEDEVCNSVMLHNTSNKPIEIAQFVFGHILHYLAVCELLAGTLSGMQHLSK